MAEKKVKNLEIHLFYSVKGGSGKTANATFRIFKTIFCSKPGENCVGTNLDEPGICFVDADFRGTMLEAYYANNYKNVAGNSFCFVKGFEPVESEAVRASRKNRDYRYYSQDIIEMKQMTSVNRLDKMLYDWEQDQDKVFVGTQTNINKHFKHSWAYNIAFCNPDYNTKNMFMTNTTNFDGEYVKVDHFRAQFKDFIYCLAQTHDVIVIDMAPGKDEYAKAIFEICYNMKLSSEFKDHYSVFKGIKKEDATVNTKVTLHLVTTPDKSHIAATSESLVEIVTELGMLEKAPEAIEVIINEPGYFKHEEQFYGDVDELDIAGYAGIITDIKKYLSKLISQSAANDPAARIKYVYQKYLDTYNFKYWGQNLSKLSFSGANTPKIALDGNWIKATENNFLNTAKVLAAEAEAKKAAKVAADGTATNEAESVLGWV